MADPHSFLPRRSSLTSPMSSRVNLRALAQRSSVSVVLRIVQSGISFLVAVLTARVLSVPDFGVLSMLLAATNIGVVVALLGHETLATRTVASSTAMGDHDALTAYRKRAAGAILGVSLVASALCVGVFLISGRLTGWGSIITAVAFSCLLVCVARTRYTQGLLRGKHYVGLALIPDGIVRPALTLMIILVSLPWLDGRTWVVAADMAIAGLITLSLAVGLERRLMGTPGKLRTVHHGHAQGSFSPQIYWSSLLAVTKSQMALLLVGHLGDSMQAALFGTALRITMVAALIPQSLYLSLSPRIARLHTLGDLTALGALLRKYTRLATFATVALALVTSALSHQIIQVFGAAYSRAGPALDLLLLSVLINAASGPTGIVLLMTKHESLHTLSLAVSLLCQIAACIVLIPIYGFLGAAYAVLVSTIIWNGMMMFFIRNRLGLAPVLAWA